MSKEVGDRQAVIIGVGLHPFGRFEGETVADLCNVAITKALVDAGIQPKDIQAVWFGHQNEYGQAMIATNAAAGVIEVPIIRVEQACASGAVALREAYLAVESGRYDIVLAVGYEQVKRGPLTFALPATDYQKYQALMGLEMQPWLAAMATRRYMKEYGATIEQFAQVAVQAHKNGCLSPEAQYQKEFTSEEVLNSRMVCSPLTLYMCCPTTHGAAAAVITNKRITRKLGRKPVSFVGWGASCNQPIGEEATLYPDFGKWVIERCAKAAYVMAGVGPEDIKVLQVHDPFPHMNFEAMEAMGFCKEGEGAQFVWDGNTEINGRIPVNTDGGTQSFGHPLGATGIRQVVETVRQLRGEAGRRQVPGNPKVGAAYDQGRGGCSVLIFNV